VSLDRTQVIIFLKKYTMVIALLFIWLLFGMLTNWVFFKPRNMSNLFRQMTITGFLACGMLLVIVTGGIDLSVGSVTGFVSAVAAFFQARVFPDLLLNWMPNASIMSRSLTSTGITVIIALITGLVIGIMEGAVISYGGVPAFIVTLGGMLIFRGGVLGVTGGKTIVPIEDPFRLIAQGYVPKPMGLILAIVVVTLIFIGTLESRRRKKAYGFDLPPVQKDLLMAALWSGLVFFYVLVMNSYRGIQNPVLLLAVVALIVHYVTKNTRFGRYVYALGGNKEATRLSGVNIKKNLFKVHAMMGLLGGMAGIVLTGYVAAGTTGGGDGYELDAIASCVIGGTSLSGGSGTVIGTVIGALVMASLVNGMSVMNMPIFWQYIIKGLVLIVAVYFDIASKKKSS
jgi:D-xylose transport system permease protein